MHADSQFPDAMAVLALESWAKQQETSILVISTDGDWKSYCEESTRLLFIDDLGEALGLFQRQTAQYACDILSEQLRCGDRTGLIKIIEDAIYDQESKFDFDPEASSFFCLDWDWPEFSLDYLGVHGIDDEGPIFEPIEFGDDYLVALVRAGVNAEVSCDFSFSIYDSIDKDYVPMGSNSISTNIEFVAEVLITFKGPMPNCQEVGEVEVVNQRIDVEFGDIEPDWRDDRDFEDRN